MKRTLYTRSQVEVDTENGLKGLEGGCKGRKAIFWM